VLILRSLNCSSITSPLSVSTLFRSKNGYAEQDACTASEGAAKARRERTHLAVRLLDARLEDLIDGGEAQPRPIPAYAGAPDQAYFDPLPLRTAA
jgi:hypothetical protein